MSRQFVLAMAAAASVPVFSAAGSTFGDPAAVDPGISSNGTSFISTVPLKDGDVVKVGGTAGAGLNTLFGDYYVVGVGSTPSTTIKLAQFPASSTIITPGAASTTAATTLVNDWFNPALWSGGVPNGVNATATFGTAGTPLTNTSTVALNGDATIGTLNFNSAKDFALISTIAGNTGPLATLNFATSSGTPTMTVAGGGSFMFSDANTTATGVASAINGGNVQGRLTIAGTQGLVIDNQNPIGAIASTTATSSPGAVRFGYQLDWSKFTGPLTLGEGAFAVTGSTSSNNVSAIPMNNDIVMGTLGAAQLELLGNQGTAYVRGIDSTNTATSIINSSSGGGPALTIGSYSQVGDSYSFAGTVGGASTDVSAGGTNFNHTGNLRIIKIGAGTQTFTGNVDIVNANALVLNGGTFSLGTTGTLGVPSGPGQAALLPTTNTVTNLAGVANNTFLHNGEFKMVGTSANVRSQAMAGLIYANGGDSSSSSTTSNASSGLDTLTLAADPAQPITLTFSNVKARAEYGPASANGNVNGVTNLFRGTNLGTAVPGTAGVANIVFTTSSGIIGANSATTGATTAASLSQMFGFSATNVGGTTPGTPTYGVLKGALADTSATGTGAGFATYDSANGVRLLNPLTEQTAVVDGTTYGAVATPAATNVRLNLAGVGTSLTGTTTQTLQIDNTSVLPATVTSTNTTATTAGLYATQGFLFSGTAPITLAGNTGSTSTTDLITGAAGAANSEDVVISSINTSAAGVTIAIPVSNPGASSHSGWITYNGPGNFTITGTQTVGNSGGMSFNGTGTTVLNSVVANPSVLAVNQGTVQLGAATSVTGNNKPNLQVAAGATLDLNGQKLIVGALNANPIFANSGYTASAGTITNSDTNLADPFAVLQVNDFNFGTTTATGTTGIFAGVISGRINVIFGKDGTTGNGTAQWLAGVNTYSGTTTVINGSTLGVARYGQLPTGTTVTLGETTNNTGGILALGDNNLSSLGSNTLISGGVSQEIAGLFTAGTATTSAVVGSNLNDSTLSVNTTTVGTDNYGGILGSATAGVGNDLALRKIGTGTLTLTGAGSNFYTGGTTVAGGTLSIARDNQLGGIGAVGGPPSNTLTPVVNNVVLDNGSLQITATTTVQTNRGLGIGPITGGSGSTGTIDTAGAGTTVIYNGTLASSGNTGVNTLNKIGAGVLNLGGASTFGGDNTNVREGKLAMNGTLGTLSNPTGFVTVGNATTAGLTPTLGGGSGAANGGTAALSAGATLDYYAPSLTVGNIQGQISLLGPGSGSAGHLAPGNSVGTLTVANLLANPGSIFDYEFNSSFNDLTDVTAIGNGATTGLVLAGGGFNLYQEGTTNTFDTPGTYHVIEFAGALGGSVGTLSVLNPDPSVTYGFSTAAGPTGGTSYVNLTIAAVPEPVTTSMLGLGALCLLGRRSRRRVVEA